MRYHVFFCIESTQEKALEYYSNYGIPSSYVVIRALAQRGGYGRRNTFWVSPPGNLFLSILMPLFPDEQYRSSLAFLGANCIIETLKTLGIKAFLRPPNDVYVLNKKISGVIGQLIHTKGHIWSAILGIGLNVNISPEISDASYQTTSIKEVLGTTTDVECMTQIILQILKKHLPIP